MKIGNRLNSISLFKPQEMPNTPTNYNLNKIANCVQISEVLQCIFMYSEILFHKVIELNVIKGLKLSFNLYGSIKSNGN